MASITHLEAQSNGMSLLARYPPLVWLLHSSPSTRYVFILPGFTPHCFHGSFLTAITLGDAASPFSQPTHLLSYTPASLPSPSQTWTTMHGRMGDADFEPVELCSNLAPTLDFSFILFGFSNATKDKQTIWLSSSFFLTLKPQDGATSCPLKHYCPINLEILMFCLWYLKCFMHHEWGDQTSLLGQS